MTKKEVLYIDTEDDITSVIDKISNANASILALVLPKRYATLKSSVNMKLMKKTADKESKKLVLITNDSALLPLAGTAGIHVADSLKSRPVIPKFEKSDIQADTIIEDEAETEQVELQATDEKSAEILAKKSEKKLSSSEKSEKIKKIKDTQKIKVPRFDKFRLKVFLLATAFIGITVGWYFAYKVMPRANVVIQAQTSRVPTEVVFTVNPNATTNKLEKKIVVGEVKEISKTITERFAATGEKNIGKKASGTMTIQNCSGSEKITIAAGTIFTDATNGFGFSTTIAVEVPGGTITSDGSGGYECTTPGEADVDVVAQESGDSRNLSARGYSSSGLGENISGFGSAMTGGTTKIVKVVSVEDISNAKQTLQGKTDESIKADLIATFKNKVVVIEDTYTVTNTPMVSSVKSGTEIDEASVSAEFTYSIMGVSNEIMEQLLEQEQSSKVDTASQSILDNGLADVVLDVKEVLKDDIITVEAITVGYVGPEIDSLALAQEIAGKRYSEAVEMIKAKAGVKDVTIELSPFWVFSVPKPEKTTIVIEVSDDMLR